MAGKYDELLDTLREAWQYAPTNPDEAVRLSLAARGGISRGSFSTGTEARLCSNLCVGEKFARHAPGVLRGYITGAIHEIQDYEAKNR